MDIGTGTGLLSFALYKQKSCRITGIDFSAEMLKEARKKAKKFRVPIRFQKINMLKLPFKNKFDLAISSFALHHIEDSKKLKVMKNIYKSLKSNARFIFGDMTVEITDDPTNKKRLEGIVDRWKRHALYALKCIGPKGAENFFKIYRTCLYEKRGILGYAKGVDSSGKKGRF